MKFPNRTIGLVLAVLMSNIINAQSLPKNSLEIKQLEAMGYEVKNADEKSDYTLVDNGTDVLVLSKNSERTAVVSSYNRRKLNDTDEFELLKVINKINTDLAYQVALGETFIAFSLYIYGPHDPKTFVKVIRLVERADNIFDSYPKLRELTR